ncbi:MAG: hypothetical protein ACOZCP_14140 [Pseudomonadota bacterium]
MRLAQVVANLLNNAAKYKPDQRETRAGRCQCSFTRGSVRRMIMRASESIG